VLEPRYPKVAELLRSAEADVLAYLAFPEEHWRSISSTNAIEASTPRLTAGPKVVASSQSAALPAPHHRGPAGAARRMAGRPPSLLQQSMARLNPEAPPLLANPLTEGLAA